MPITPDDVFRTGYYWYQWFRRLEKGEPMAARGTRMPTAWWENWAIGLMTSVYPVMAEVLKPEYVQGWRQGLYNRLVEEGVPEARATEISGIGLWEE